MNTKKRNFDKYFETEDLTENPIFSKTIVKSLVRSILEPIIENNTKATILARLKGVEDIDGLIKRLEYSANVNLKQFSDFEFSKFDVKEIGFIVLNTQRYNCAFLFKKTNEEEYEIYLKINSKLVLDVYETIKSIFLVNLDECFYEHRPERRENNLMNDAIFNILKHFEETIKDNEYNTKIQETYKTVNSANTEFRNEIYQNARQIAHEIKNQLSILDIYARIFEKKTQDSETTSPIRKSIEIIKTQIDKFKNIDVLNLQEKNIKAIIQDSIKTYQDVLKQKNNKVILIDEMPSIEANAFVDEDKLTIVINNIIKNANDSTKNDEITIKLTQMKEKIKISFINHGDMIAKNNQNKIFDNGYTTKKDGWGIGLSVCKKYIGSHFGTLELEKSDKKETIFSLVLPLAQTR